MSDTWQAGDRIDRYVLEKPLGKGGFGEVWRARLHGPMGFQRAVAVMELVHGVSLRALLERCAEVGTRLPPHLALQIALQVARGLAYAHALTDADGRSLQVVHRDLKPENVMLGSDGVVRVLDFGIARSLSNLEQTRTGDASVRGTPRYLSPEQLEGGSAVDARSDLFALGALLFEALVGRPLFSADQVFALMYEVERLVVVDVTARLASPPPALGEPGSYGIEEATRAVTAHMLRREFDAMSCMTEHEPGIDQDLDVIYDWYAEVGAAGDLETFAVHWRGVPSPAAFGCLGRMTEGLRLPATGHPVTIDLQGRGRPGPASPGSTIVVESVVDGDRLGLSSEQGDVYDIEKVKDSIRVVKSQIKGCYEDDIRRRIAAGDPSFAGRIDATFDVSETGRLSGLRHDMDQEEMQPMCDCLVLALLDADFPPSADSYEITYPFNFFSG